MCVNCGNFNYKKRNNIGNLKDKTAIITGGRSKIGYQVALKLLRSGANVIVTTRFPTDAAMRFSKEVDSSTWIDKLKIYALNLLIFKEVDNFLDWVYKDNREINILINNAAQTIWRPKEFYGKLIEMEKFPNKFITGDLTNLIHSQSSSNIEPKTISIKYINESFESENQISQYFNSNEIDDYNHVIDKRPENSWVHKLDEIPLTEFLEVFIINVIAPFLLISKLKPIMKGKASVNNYVINVSSMEGKFNKFNKNYFHPHTNMAKAALNMLTRTSAGDFAKSNILMNSVDTGWISDENPYPISSKNKDNKFNLPIDEVDGAARILDPIFTMSPYFGEFLKDYKRTQW